ncbi:MAG: HlyD family type I secretion periplasmic adaptor subunit [Gammaproteobacteria bacterium]|nr:MAG: HlyD family type I secretion periplasmic adaptor subunit [Gammaproteobacteria bacterium]
MTQNSTTLSSKALAGLPRARARFLAQAIQLEEQGPSSIVRGAILLALALLVAAVGWAWTTEVAEIAKTRGEVMPAGLIHDIQHLEGGIVSEILVRDGDRVSKGQLLLRFAPPATQSELEQARVRKASLQMEAERLEAMVEGRKPDIDPDSSPYPALARKQLTIYQAQLASHESEAAVLDAQIHQRETELKRQQAQAEAIEKELALLEEQVRIRSKGVNNQLVARTELLSTQTRLAETQRELRTVRDGIIVARSALDEARERRAELDTRFKKDIEIEAGKVLAQLAEVEQTLVRLQDRAARLQVRAPVDGIVQGLSITRINAVVEPGQVIMQLVPVDDELIVEARIPPTEIGHVHLGQRADVRIDSYDPSRVGSAKGTVQRISASTYLDEKRNPYYRAEIALDKDYVGDDPQRFRIIPGMTVEADIKTGSKTILDYLMLPVTRGLDNAFRER